MAVGMSPVHWQLAGSLAFTHDSVSVTVPRARDRCLLVTLSSALAALHSLFPRGLRLLAGPVHRPLRFRRGIKHPTLTSMASLISTSNSGGFSHVPIMSITISDSTGVMVRFQRCFISAQSVA